MASKKHTYKIIFNEQPSQGFDYIYDFGNVKNIRIEVSNNKAVASYEMGTEKKFEDFITFQTPAFRDIYRKVLMCHVFKQNKGMSVEKIIIEIDGEVKEYDKQTPHFPFMFSILDGKDVALNYRWDDQLLKKVLSLTKSTQDTDPTSACVFSFLENFGRDYEIDRFLNLWTAMNTYYSKLGGLFDDKMREVFKKVTDEELDCMKIKGNDTLSLNALIALNTEDFRGRFSAKNFDIDSLYELSKKLEKINTSSKEYLYEGIEESRHNNSALLNKNFSDLCNFIKEKTSLNPHCWFTFAFPYILRNRYLHGSFTPPIFSAYNDPEINYLEIVNRVMSDYLMDEIPNIVNMDKLDDKTFKVMLTWLYHNNFKHDKRLYQETLDDMFYYIKPAKRYNRY